MHIIQSNGYQLELGSISESSFSEKLNAFKNEKIVLFADENINSHDVLAGGHRALQMKPIATV
jgi:hypothetical protein